MRRYAWFLVLVSMVSVISLGCLRSTAVRGDEESMDEEDLITVTLYFVDDQGEGLYPEERTLPAEVEDRLPAVIVEETLAGPENEGLRAVIPGGTRLLGMEVSRGRATVNLSGEVRDNFNLGAMGEGYIIYSLVNALTELPGIREVQFLVEGEVMESIGGHFLLEEPFTRDESLIRS